MDSRDIADTGILDEGALLAEQRATNASTRAFLTQPFPTLGAQLVREARYHTSRKIPAFPWLQPLEITMEHLATLPVPSQDRFQRIDAMPSGYSFGAGALTYADMNIPTAFNGMVASGPNDQSFASPLQISVAGFVGQTIGKHPTLTDQREYTDSIARPDSSVTEQYSLEPARSLFSAQMPATPEAATSRQHQAGTEPVRSLRAHTGSALAPHIQQKVKRFVGEDAKHMRIHDDPASQAFAHAQKADAVTLGQHVFFARDRFHPEDEQGFALLTHEALHVVQAMRPGSSWRRATQAGTREEERQAATLEHQALAARHNASWESQPAMEPTRSPFASQASVVPRHQGETGTVEVAATFTGSAPRERPMRAATDRIQEDNVTQQALPDVREFKRAVYRDLMRQIKMDQERGG